jgi:nitrogen fixation protein NifB
VAVASSDGQLIDRHLGQSEGFRIYELSAGGAHRFVEERAVPARLDRHSADGLPALLADVHVVLAARAGPGAIRQLAAAGVQVFAVEGGVERALGAIGRRGFVLDAPGVQPGSGGVAPTGCGPSSCGPEGCEPGGCGPGGGADGCRGGGCA